MDKQSKTDLKYVGGVAALVGALTAGGIYLGNKLTTPPTLKPIVLGWDCTNSIGDNQWQNQTFEFVYKTNLNSPWIHYTNIVGTNRIVIPNNLSQASFTIGKTWVTGDTNWILYRKD